MSSESKSKDNETKGFIPSELRLSQKWDRAIEGFVIKGAAGLIFAGLASVVLFRKLVALLYAAFTSNNAEYCQLFSCSTNKHRRRRLLKIGIQHAGAGIRSGRCV